MKSKNAESSPQKEILLANKIFSHKYTLLIACILITLTLFFALNYILNCVTHLPQIFRDAEHAGSYFGPGNLFVFKASRWPFYAAFLAVIAFVIARFVYRIRTSLREYNVNQKGSARWTELKDIQVQYRSVPMKTDYYKGKGGVPICQNKYLIYIDDEAVNNLIIGLTRSGKGEMTEALHTSMFDGMDSYGGGEGDFQNYADHIRVFSSVVDDTTANVLILFTLNTASGGVEELIRTTYLFEANFIKQEDVWLVSEIVRDQPIRYI